MIYYMPSHSSKLVSKNGKNTHVSKKMVLLLIIGPFLTMFFIISVAFFTAEPSPTLRFRAREVGFLKLIFRALLIELEKIKDTNEKLRVFKFQN